MEAVDDPDCHKTVTMVRADSLDEALILYWLSKHYPEKWWGVQTTVFHERRKGEDDAF